MRSAGLRNSLDVYCVSDAATIGAAIEVIQHNECRCVIVRRPDSKVVGVFSEGDVMRALLDGANVHAPIRNLLRPSFTFFTTRDIAAARRHFLDGMTLIPVLDAEFRLVDVIKLRDVFDLGA